MCEWVSEYVWAWVCLFVCGNGSIVFVRVSVHV